MNSTPQNFRKKKDFINFQSSPLSPAVFSLITRAWEHWYFFCIRAMPYFIFCIKKQTYCDCEKKFFFERNVIERNFSV